MSVVGPARAAAVTDGHGLSPAAFRAIFDAHVTHVAHTLRRLGVRESELEEAAHDTFLTVYRRYCDYDASRPLRPWISGIAYRVAAEYRRRAKSRPQGAGDDLARLADESAPGAEERLVADADRVIVVEALDMLELDRRAVLVMHDIDEEPMPVIAEALGIPLNTGYSRLRLAREDFAAAVKRLCARRGPVRGGQ